MLHVYVVKAKKAKTDRKSIVIQGNRTAFATKILLVFTLVYDCGINAHIQIHKIAAATFGQASIRFSIIYLLADAS